MNAANAARGGNETVASPCCSVLWDVNSVTNGAAAALLIAA